MNKSYPQNFGDLIAPIKKELFITVLLAGFGALALLIAPLAITISVHHYLVGQTDNFFIWIVLAGVGLATKQILHIFSLGYAHIVEAKFRYKLRKEFSDKLSRLPLGFFSDTTSGAVRKFISQDTIKIHTIVAHGFSEFSAGVALPLGCVIIMLIIEWRTALMILLAIVLILVVAMLWISLKSKGMHEINTRYEVAQREMSHSVIEMVDGIEEIKNFGIAGSLFKRFDDALQRFSAVSFEWLNTSSKAYSFVMAAIQPTVMLFLSLAICLFSIHMQWLAPEYSILFMLLTISLPSSLLTLMQLGNFIREGRLAIDNLLSLYAQPDQVYRAQSTAFTAGDIVFKDVSFSYDGENAVLNNINCTIERGKLTALVGASGSGKTTMARLIARFWDVASGSVSIGGVDVRALSEVAMLSNISLVFQDVALMNASIADNIALAKQDASREEIINAAKAAQIDDRISKLPNGYDSVYGAENVVLSGGERQRLTIARAFLADAPIVLLDEATAQADAESEMAIQRAISSLCKDKTVVMIAHRLSSIVAADKIIVLDGGKIIERGKHDQLLQTDGAYKAMWLAQNDLEGVQ